jgi:very-short-patch-repair endonuclease
MPRKTRGTTTTKIVQAAREQRRQPTPAEKKLWDALRGRRLAGLKFRRQHPYGQFVLDAFCVEHQLEVEVDGDVHDDLAQAARDAERTKFLKERGIRVLRVSNEEVENNLRDVLRRIVDATRTPLS